MICRRNSVVVSAGTSCGGSSYFFCGISSSPCGDSLDCACMNVLKDASILTDFSVKSHCCWTTAL